MRVLPLLFCYSFLLLHQILRETLFYIFLKPANQLSINQFLFRKCEEKRQLSSVSQLRERENNFQRRSIFDPRRRNHRQSQQKSVGACMIAKPGPACQSAAKCQSFGSAGQKLSTSEAKLSTSAKHLCTCYPHQLSTFGEKLSTSYPHRLYPRLCADTLDCEKDLEFCSARHAFFRNVGSAALAVRPKVKDKC